MAEQQISEVASNKCFGGLQKIFCHESVELGCRMNFGVYLPPDAVEKKYSEGKKLPSIYWLSGLTCTEANFVQKAGFQRYAAEHNLIVVNPDTSPRGCQIEGEDDAYDFGTGAGFYVDATEEKWKSNYRMYSYVTKELPQIIEQNFPVIQGKRSIFGHSMGGHGALVCYLKNPETYVSVSAFAPICNPSLCGWGKKAFTGYLGPNQEFSWQEYDACHLVRIRQNQQEPIDILIDQGKSDQFYEQLLPENFADACKSSSVNLDLRMHEGYDHSYFFISTFMEDHIKFHAKYWTD